jgi:hypothetical protein
MSAAQRSWQCSQAWPLANFAHCSRIQPHGLGESFTNGWLGRKIPKSGEPVPITMAARCCCRTPFRGPEGTRTGVPAVRQPARQGIPYRSIRSQLESSGTIMASRSGSADLLRDAIGVPYCHDGSRDHVFGGRFHGALTAAAERGPPMATPLVAFQYRCKHQPKRQGY